MSSIRDRIKEQLKDLPPAPPPDKTQANDEDIKMYLHSISDAIRTKKKEAELLEDIKYHITCGDMKTAQEMMLSAMSENEKGFLATRTAAAIIRTGEKNLYGHDFYEAMGKPINFPAELKKIADGHFVFTLPPIAVRPNTTRKAVDGNAFRHLMYYLIGEYEKEHSRIEIMDRPTVIFEHYVDRNSNLRRVPDPDNLEIKVVIDCLQNYFLRNDSILNLTLVQTGILSDKTCTKVHVIAHREQKSYRKTEM